MPVSSCGAGYQAPHSVVQVEERSIECRGLPTVTRSLNPGFQISDTPQHSRRRSTTTPQPPRPILARPSEPVTAQPENLVHKAPAPDHRPICEIPHTAPQHLANRHTAAPLQPVHRAVHRRFLHPLPHHNCSTGNHRRPFRLRLVRRSSPFRLFRSLVVPSIPASYTLATTEQVYFHMIPLWKSRRGD